MAFSPTIISVVLVVSCLNCYLIVTMYMVQLLAVILIILYIVIVVTTVNMYWLVRALMDVIIVLERMTHPIVVIHLVLFGQIK